MTKEEEIKKELTKEILKSFHSQFAENQNHQQKLFIHFFSTILIVAIPFGIVFINISDEANLWNVTRDINNGNITSYAVSHLIASWMLIQVALITLSSFTLIMPCLFTDI